MNEVIEILSNRDTGCPLMHCALRQLGRFGRGFGNEGLGATLLAEVLIHRYDSGGIGELLLALCPREGSLVPLTRSMYLLGRAADRDVIEAVMDACVERETRLANAGCRTFAACFGTAARARRTVAGMVYDAVLQKVLTSREYIGLDHFYGDENDLREDAVNGLSGWAYDEAMEGYYRFVYPAGLEIIVNPEAERNTPFPEEDLSAVKRLVVYGIAHPDAMRNTVEGVLERTTGLRHFAALNVVSCDDSFKVLEDVELPDLQTVTVDVREPWGDLLVLEDDDFKTDQVAYPWRMAKKIRDSLKRPHKIGPKLIFRHDILQTGETSNPITWLESADEYVPCPGAVFAVP